MKKAIGIGAVAAYLVCSGLPVYAEGGKFAMALKAGTLGGGIEGIMKLTDQFNARLGINMFEYSYGGTESDVDYDINLSLFTVAAILDWFPFQNGFHLSGGMMSNQNEVAIEAKAAGSYTIGDTTYTSAQVGSLTGNIDFNDVAPYFGLGWGTPFGKGNHWSLALDLGAIYQGSPNVSLSTNGTLASNAAFQADLAREQSNVEDALDSFQFYPVASIGVAYKF